MGVITPSRAQLERAAEQTIEAAAAALLWAGQDSRGVLEHVASASAAQMAQSRCAYALYQAARRDVAAEDRQTFDEDLSNYVLESFEVAALPAPAVPQWTEAICVAMRKASDDKESAVGLRALHGSVRYHALTVCSWWGRDPLLLEQIGTLSRIVLLQTSPVPVDQF
jgi:hypothetical protein